MRNQYIAKVLVHNKVVPEDVVKAHWGEITDSMDIGQVLVRAGILKESMYAKVLAFVKTSKRKMRRRHRLLLRHILRTRRLPQLLRLPHHPRRNRRMMLPQLPHIPHRLRLPHLLQSL